jgi:hypothetical protein
MNLSLLGAAAGIPGAAGDETDWLLQLIPSFGLAWVTPSSGIVLCHDVHCNEKKGNCSNIMGRNCVISISILHGFRELNPFRFSRLEIPRN